MNKSSFELVYKSGDVLAKGGFGTVFAGVRVIDETPVAIKNVAKIKIKEWVTLNGIKVPMELKLLQSVQSVEGVIKLLDFYERNDSFIYVMERPSDCKDLFDFILVETPFLKYFAVYFNFTITNKWTNQIKQ